MNTRPRIFLVSRAVNSCVKLKNELEVKDLLAHSRTTNQEVQHLLMIMKIVLQTKETR
jgi:hypothetical protein